jgi:hypothetical protein
LELAVRKSEQLTNDKLTINTEKLGNIKLVRWRNLAAAPSCLGGEGYGTNLDSIPAASVANIETKLTTS